MPKETKKPDKTTKGLVGLERDLGRRELGQVGVVGREVDLPNALGVELVLLDAVIGVVCCLSVPVHVVRLRAVTEGNIVEGVVVPVDFDQVEAGVGGVRASLNLETVDPRIVNRLVVGAGRSIGGEEVAVVATISNVCGRTYTTVDVVTFSLKAYERVVALLEEELG